MPAYYVELEQETNLDQHDLKNVLWLMNTLYYGHNTVIFIFIFILFLVGFDWSPNSEKRIFKANDDQCPRLRGNVTITRNKVVQPKKLSNQLLLIIKNYEGNREINGYRSSHFFTFSTSKQVCDKTQNSLSP